MNRNEWITYGVIFVVIVIAIIILLPKSPEPLTEEDVAICIGENSVLYVQLGCSHCEDQEDMFGDYVEHLNRVDCFYEREKCTEDEISATPTWMIGGDKYEGVQSIETLKNLTGC
jgi:hypothetical protein